MAENCCIRILIVDDHPLMRDGLTSVLEGEPDLKLVAEAGTGEEAIALSNEHKPDVILMDLRLPDMSGVEAIRTIRKTHSGVHIVVLTTYPGDVQASRAIQAGATGYLLKATMARVLVETIRTVHAGGFCVPPEISAELARYVAVDKLTGREIEILREIAAGCANKVIADRLSISEDTVKSHITSILRKLNANDRTHAVTIALRRGFLEL